MKTHDDWLVHYQQPGEPVICSYFGCGQHLTIQEQLFGKLCIRHQPMKQIRDPADKLPINEGESNPTEEVDQGRGAKATPAKKEAFRP